MFYARVTFNGVANELRFRDEDDMMSFFRLNGFVESDNIFFNDRVKMVHNDDKMLFCRTVKVA